jgi:hypothetical protein
MALTFNVAAQKRARKVGIKLIVRNELPEDWLNRIINYLNDTAFEPTAC